MGVGCGLPAWIDEAEQPERGSPTRRRRCKQGVKVSTWKGRRKEGEMWLLVKGRGRGGRYFRGSQKFGIASAKKLARKVSSDWVPYSELCTICEHHKRFR